VKRVLPLFLAVLLIILIIPIAHASSYVGYTSANLGSNVCPSNCESTTATTQGIGAVLQSPLTGTLVSVGVFTGAAVPNQIVLASFSGTPVTSTEPCSGGGSCPFVTSSQSFTVLDVEGVTGLAAQSFNTIVLANPPSVTVATWTAVIFQRTGGTGTGFIMLCGQQCGSIGGSTIAGQVSDLELNFATTSPVVGNAYASITGDIAPAGMIGATFQAGSVANTQSSQCYGNCGNPAVTFVNTNLTHTLNFNSSMTILYVSQSNLNGVVNNVSARVAKNYANGNGVILGLFTVDPACSGNTPPFTPQCPGFLQIQQSFQNPQKGTISMPTNIQIQNGQFIGIALTASFNGMDINDTNTGVTVYQSSGRMPGLIQSVTSLGSQKEAIYAWVTGNTIIVAPPVSPSNCQTPACGLAQLGAVLGGGVVGGLFVWIILTLTIGGFFLFMVRHNPAAIPWVMGLTFMISMVILIAESLLGLLPPWIPLVLITLTAVGASFALWSFYNRGNMQQGAL
jgi:hypothetical protein